MLIILIVLDFSKPIVFCILYSYVILDIQLLIKKSVSRLKFNLEC